MLNATTRTGLASPVFKSMMSQDDGISTNRKTPYSAEKPDKSGAHSIAALNRFICDSKNGSTYSNNIKAAIGEKPDLVNPYIPHKTHNRNPDEKFTIQNNCGCGSIRSKKPLLSTVPTTQEGFCGCGDVFMQHSKEISFYGPLVLVILILIAALLISKIIINRLSGRSAAGVARTVSNPASLTGGVIDSDFESII
jgi:hypothetical protein